ncbi:hypothetical protein SRHO_G00303470 [Serrasalmus rhombeus]
MRLCFHPLSNSWQPPGLRKRRNVVVRSGGIISVVHTQGDNEELNEPLVNKPRGVRRQRSEFGDGGKDKALTFTHLHSETILRDAETLLIKGCAIIAISGSNTAASGRLKEASLTGDDKCPCAKCGCSAGGEATMMTIHIVAKDNNSPPFCVAPG